MKSNLVDYQEIQRQNDSQQKYLQTLEEEDFGDDKIGRIRKFLWNMTEYPETSVAARVRIVIHRFVL